MLKLSSLTCLFVICTCFSLSIYAVFLLYVFFCICFSVCVTKNSKLFPHNSITVCAFKFLKTTLSELFIRNHLIWQHFISHSCHFGECCIKYFSAAVKWDFCLNSGLLVLHAGWSTQPSGEALCSQPLRADAHVGAHASRDTQAAVRGAAFSLPIFCTSCCAT